VVAAGFFHRLSRGRGRSWYVIVGRDTQVPEELASGVAVFKPLQSHGLWTEQVRDEGAVLWEVMVILLFG
jgi:hypothetical protein